MTKYTDEQLEALSCAYTTHRIAEDTHYCHENWFVVNDDYLDACNACRAVGLTDADIDAHFTYMESL